MVEQVDINKRKFFGDDEAEVYYIEAPSAEAIRGADWQYSKTFTQCLVEGITTSAEMVDILTRRGIIGPDFEQRANELSLILGEKLEALHNANTMEDKRVLSNEVAQARDEFYQWNQRLNGPMNNTAEQMSDDARLDYLTSCMVTNSEGTPVWNSYDEYLKEKSQSLALKARFEVMLYVQGLDSDFYDKTPEAIAMKEVEDDVLRKAEAILQAAEVAEKEEVVAEKTKPKKAVKKTTKKTTAKKKKEE